MIEYVEIRNSEREIVGIVDNFKSIIWHGEYYGTGDFEIYAPCTPLNLALLVENNFVTRPDEENVGIIEKIEYTFSATDGRMIVAAGRFAKSILDRRIIYNLENVHSQQTIVLQGNIETAARQVVTDNAINCAFDSERNISILALGAMSGTINQEITNETGNPATLQIWGENLLTWTDEFLKKYKCGARVVLNSNKILEYVCYEGKNRAIDNTDGNEPVIFSQDFENLISSQFSIDTTKYKNAAIVGGTGDASNKDFSVARYTDKTGINRREVLINAENLKKGTSIQDYWKYLEQLETTGFQKLDSFQIVETFDGEINLNSLTFKYKTNYNIGDIITMQDSETKLFKNTRIVEITEIQDSNGYQLTGKYET